VRISTAPWSTPLGIKPLRQRAIERILRAKRPRAPWSLFATNEHGRSFKRPCRKSPSDPWINTRTLGEDNDHVAGDPDKNQAASGDPEASGNTEKSLTRSLPVRQSRHCCRRNCRTAPFDRSNRPYRTEDRAKNQGVRLPERKLLSDFELHLPDRGDKTRCSRSRSSTLFA